MFIRSILFLLLFHFSNLIYSQNKIFRHDKEIALQPQEKTKAVMLNSCSCEEDFYVVEIKEIGLGAFGEQLSRIIILPYTKDLQHNSGKKIGYNFEVPIKSLTKMELIETFCKDNILYIVMNAFPKSSFSSGYILKVDLKKSLIKGKALTEAIILRDGAKNGFKILSAELLNEQLFVTASIGEYLEGYSYLIKFDLNNFNVESIYDIEFSQIDLDWDYLFDLSVVDNELYISSFLLANKGDIFQSFFRFKETISQYDFRLNCETADFYPGGWKGFPIQYPKFFAPIDKSPFVNRNGNISIFGHAQAGWLTEFILFDKFFDSSTNYKKVTKVGHSVGELSIKESVRGQLLLENINETQTLQSGILVRENLNINQNYNFNGFLFHQNKLEDLTIHKSENLRSFVSPYKISKGNWTDYYVAKYQSENLNEWFYLPSCEDFYNYHSSVSPLIKNFTSNEIKVSSLSEEEANLKIFNFKYEDLLYYPLDNFKTKCESIK